MYKKGVVPSQSYGYEDRILESGPASATMCPPMWDRASCFPATHAGQMSVIPCMAEFNEVYYDTTGRTRFVGPERRNESAETRVRKWECGNESAKTRAQKFYISLIY